MKKYILIFILSIIFLCTACSSEKKTNNYELYNDLINTVIAAQDSTLHDNNANNNSVEISGIRRESSYNNGRSGIWYTSIQYLIVTNNCIYIDKIPYQSENGWYFFFSEIEYIKIGGTIIWENSNY